mmetsp:Transcript_67326/g.197663  ORF Transcript_67326/g.197663 Transcript_67326/m.197663 type:complete len:456 (-) Transcript_67326:36-1403(-)
MGTCPCMNTATPDMDSLGASLEEDLKVPRRATEALPGSAALDEVATNDLAERMRGYEQRRREKREAKKKKNMTGLGQFLSNVPEVNSDVQYRFNFIVSGTGAWGNQVAEATCNSQAAKSLPDTVNDMEEGAENEEGELTIGASNFNRALSPVAEGSMAAPPDYSFIDVDGTRRQRTAAPVARKDLRCLCSVTDKGKPALAKFAFRTVSLPGQFIPPCANRLETLNTAIVFVLIVDKDMASFKQQLSQLAESVEELRQKSKPRVRPVRAALLCYEKEPETGAKELWPQVLADFEQANGDVWTFGPVRMSDGNGLHAAFEEIACERIPFAAEGGHVDRASIQGKDKVAKFATGDFYRDDEYDEGGNPLAASGVSNFMSSELLAKHTEMIAKLSGGSKFTSEGSTPSVASSEGWQKPPVFEAEYQGSECSENAIELYKQLYGEDGVPQGAATPRSQLS